MPDPQGPPPDEALKSLDRRLDALAASQRREPRRHDAEGGSDMGYRVLGELFGGILGGLGLGWVVDRFAGTSPWGLIAGVLGGLVLAIVLVVRSASRVNGRQSGGPAGPVGSAMDVQAPSGSKPDDN